MKRKEKTGRFLCFLLCICILSGCERKKEPEPGMYRIYYLDTEETRLVDEYYAPETEGVEGRIEEVLEYLEGKPDNVEYKSVFVGGVEVEDWELRETKLSLTFNQAYKDLEAASELLLRAAVVQSLVQIEGVDYISFYIDGNPLLDKSGDEIGYMRAEDFVQNTGSSLHSYQTAKLKLYFANDKGDKLEAEETSVRYNSNMSVEKLVVEQLLKGPSDSKHRAVIPAGTKVLGVSVKDNVCYVNFDEVFLNVTEQVNPRATVYAIVNSIIDNGETARVQILVNGEIGITYQESIDLSKPFSREPDMVETEEK